MTRTSSPIAVVTCCNIPISASVAADAWAQVSSSSPSFAISHAVAIIAAHFALFSKPVVCPDSILILLSN
jgi:hypothetical protein